MHSEPAFRDTILEKYFQPLNIKNLPYLLVCFLPPSGTFSLKNIFILRLRIRSQDKGLPVPIERFYFIFNGLQRKHRSEAFRALAVLPVQQFAHRLAAGFVRLFRILVLRAASAATGRRLGSFRFAACRAPIGEAGLVRLQLKLFCANHADFNGKAMIFLGYKEREKCCSRKAEAVRLLAWLSAWPGRSVVPRCIPPPCSHILFAAVWSSVSRIS
jgi:hypothetical protein